MIEQLSILIENFPGAANQTRCFAHILNLVAKSILRQFDTPKKAADSDSRVDDASNALAALAKELEDTETEADDGSEEAEDDNEMGGEDDGDDGLGDGPDGRDGMSEGEVDELETSLVPVRLMLTKASRFELSQNYLI